MIERWFLVMILGFVPIIVAFMVPIDIGIYFIGLGVAVGAVGGVMAILRIREDRRRERQQGLNQ